jgi:RNA recognition motif-containing protein
MRGVGGRGGADDLPTLRVTNISEDTGENDLRELFGSFGRVARVYVGRDRETGAGKGFAFVSFDDRAVAEKAMQKVNGRGYDNLILSVQWSRKFLPSDIVAVGTNVGYRAEGVIYFRFLPSCCTVKGELNAPSFCQHLSQWFGHD